MADAAPKAPGASDDLASPPPPKVSSKDAYKYVPVLEEFLVVAFVLEMLWCVWTFWSMDSILLELCVMLVVVAVVLEVVKRIISWIGTQLSVFVHYCGMVDTSRPHPLKGRRQMKKWREQSWQLFVHGFMAMVEIFILYRSAPRNWDELVGAFRPSRVDNATAQIHSSTPEGFEPPATRGARRVHPVVKNPPLARHWALRALARTRERSGLARGGRDLWGGS